jgi:hypothetical protein
MIWVILSNVTFAGHRRLKIIGRAAFRRSGVRDIRIPDMLEVIDPICFEMCTWLWSLTFGPDSRVQRLDESALAWCMSLKSICIPTSVEFIGAKCFCGCSQMTSVTVESGSKLSVIERAAFWGCEMLGPSIQLPSSFEAIPVECFCNCCVLSSITFDPHCALREIRQNAFSSCALKSFCVPDSVLVIDWSCFSKCREVIDISFESPSKTEQIINFNRETNGTTSIPDSVMSMTVGECGRGGFVCTFGRDSRLQDLQTSCLTHKGAGFLRLTESSMTRIRNVNEWRRIGRCSEKSILVGSCMNFPFWLIRSRDVSCRHYQHSSGV